MKRLEGIVHPLVAADRDAFLQQVCACTAHVGTQQLALPVQVPPPYRCACAWVLVTRVRSTPVRGLNGLGSCDTQLHAIKRLNPLSRITWGLFARRYPVALPLPLRAP